MLHHQSRKITKNSLLSCFFQKKTPENFERKYPKYSFQKPKIQYFEIDPNTLDVIGWQKLGFSEKQALVIVNYESEI